MTFEIISITCFKHAETMRNALAKAENDGEASVFVDRENALEIMDDLTLAQWIFLQAKERKVMERHPKTEAARRYGDYFESTAFDAEIIRKGINTSLESQRDMMVKKGKFFFMGCWRASFAAKDAETIRDHLESTATLAAHLHADGITLIAPKAEDSDNG